MPSSLDLSHVADAPRSIIELAQRRTDVAINLRPDHWSEELVQEARTDGLWRMRRTLYHGLFMYPGLTTFLNDLQVGSGVVVCHQDHAARIFSTKGTVHEVYWLGQPDDRGTRGVLASIRFIQSHSVDQIWANFILAVAVVPPTNGSLPVQDPDGGKFIRAYERLRVTA